MSGGNQTKMNKNKNKNRMEKNPGISQYEKHYIFSSLVFPLTLKLFQSFFIPKSFSAPAPTICRIPTADGGHILCHMSLCLFHFQFLMSVFKFAQFVSSKNQAHSMLLFSAVSNQCLHQSRRFFHSSDCTFQLQMFHLIGCVCPMNVPTCAYMSIFMMLMLLKHKSIYTYRFLREGEREREHSCAWEGERRRGRERES